MHTDDAASGEEIGAAFGVGRGDANRAMQGINVMASEADSAAGKVDEFHYFGALLGGFDTGFGLSHGDAWAATALDATFCRLRMGHWSELLTIGNEQRVGDDAWFGPIEWTFRGRFGERPPEIGLGCVEREAEGSVARVVHNAREQFAAIPADKQFLFESERTRDADDKTVVSNGDRGALVDEGFAGEIVARDGDRGLKKLAEGQRVSWW
jgi:hypothetical protein